LAVGLRAGGGVICLFGSFCALWGGGEGGVVLGRVVGRTVFGLFLGVG